ncbi:MAG: thioredoxin domain-containing protein [Anaerolineae bacterium]|nr:thioredoxin domain-containing protein [Anaerolineae bacterium]
MNSRFRNVRRAAVLAVAALCLSGCAVVAETFGIADQPVSLPAPLPDFGHYDGLPAGVTEDGLYRLGAADAPVLMEDVSSFTCGHCAAFHATLTGRLIDPYIREGTLAYVLRPLANSEQANRGTRAALCAGRQDPLKFWEMTDVAFAWIGEDYTQADMVAAAQALDLDVRAFRACLDSALTTDIVQNLYAGADARGVAGVPALFFNGARPTCAASSYNSNCEGNLPYEWIVQNIEQHLSE